MKKTIANLLRQAKQRNNDHVRTVNNMQVYMRKKYTRDTTKVLSNHGQKTPLAARPLDLGLTGFSSEQVTELIRIAHVTTANMLRGNLRRRACEFCNSHDNNHGHHPDYTKPAFIMWLCANCHIKEHTRINNERKV